MENEFRVIDLILAVILAVVMIVGIGMCIAKVPTLSGELTTENYQQYFDIRTALNSVSTGRELSLIFRPNHRYDLTDVTVTVSISGKSINSQTLRLSLSATYDKPYIYKETLGYYQPSIEEAMSGGWYNVNYEIISVSGQFNRGKLK